MGHVGSKTRSLGQILEKPCLCSRGHTFNPIIMTLDWMFVLMKSPTSLKIGHVGSKTRLVGQMLEKPYVCSRGLIFSLIMMILDQHVCLDEIALDINEILLKAA